MTKKSFKRTRDDFNISDDGFRKQKLSNIRQEKNKKKTRNLNNAIRSKNIDALMDYDEE